ncbi:MAG: glycosyltransferase family 2 protein [Desulfovibrionaceae bacterium]
MPAPEISVILCTRDNAALLAPALESLRRQTLPPEAFEIVVVDNGSGDATPEIARAFCAGFAPARYVAEPVTGLAVARNTGLDAARAPVAAFLDDDAEADPGWLAALLDVYARIPEAWAVGGAVLPIWDAPRPDWLDERYFRSLSLVEWGPVERPLAWPERVIGVNCSFRMEVFERLGRFDPDLGRMGRALLGHEDTEIQERIHGLGKKVMYTPAAVVRHHVPAWRMTREYFERRHQGAAVSQRIMDLRRAGREAEALALADQARREGGRAED